MASFWCGCRAFPSQVYVQHLLKNPDNATALVSSLDSGAYVFVCGATAMGTDVLEAIVDIIADKKSAFCDFHSRLSIHFNS